MAKNSIILGLTFHFFHDIIKKKLVKYHECSFRN